MNIDAKKFAREWIDAWNSHDLGRILSHYSEDVEVTTPMIKVALGVQTGTLKGKEKVKGYWEAALQKIPDLHFELKEVTEGVESVALCYRSVFGKTAIEVMYFNKAGKVHRVIAHYT